MKPEHALSVVLDVFTETTKSRIHGRVAELVRASAYDDVSKKLLKVPNLPEADALQRALDAALPVVRQQLGRYGALGGTVDDITREMREGVTYLATSGPVVDPPT